MIHEVESVIEQNGRTHARQNFVVDSVSEFVKAVCTIDRCLIRNGLDTNEIMLFRGHADMDYGIVPSLGRGRKNPIDISIFNEERNMIEMAKNKMPNVFRNDMEPLELLALLQHHGIPTRLLDVTENALVALYFACCSEPDKDGEVIVFKHNEKHIPEFPLINAIAYTYRLIGTGNHSITLNWFFGGAISQPYFQEQSFFTRNVRESEELKTKWIVNNCSRPIFVYAPIHSIRQQMQRGRYILFPNRLRKGDECETFDAIIDPISKDDRCVIGEIGIEAQRKQAILTELQYFGISNEALFPDSIDSVCKGIVKDAKEKNQGRMWTNDKPIPLWER